MVGSSGPVLVLAEGLCKRLGGVPVLRGVDLEVTQGSLHAVVGPRGSGKTTVLNVLTGFLAPDSGSVWFAGVEVTGRLPKPGLVGGMARALRSPVLFDGVAAADYASFVAGHDAPARTCLGDRAEVGLGLLSPLERTALEIELALSLRPRLLVLDEPSAGLGPGQLHALTDVVRRAAAGRTVLLVDHHPGLVRAVADQVTTLVGGRVVGESAYLSKADQASVSIPAA
ncbi:MAG TPA: ATP-binding cassette domain-containing protein [Pedococcus sp.]|nr:ATP-binding cassette domain-containing protein [Pedococcus sp.]